MTAGYYAPLPPARTGVADYAASLLQALQKLGPIMPNQPDADIFLYQLGNNQLHRDIYRQALLKPGVVVLHDAILQHFFLGCLDEASYIEEFVYNYGEWNRELAGDLWQTRRRSAVDPRYFRYPMLRRIVERSPAVIVHNPGAAAMVRNHVPEAQVVEIPHLFAPPEALSMVGVERLRRSWNLPVGTFVFGVFGHLRESKRLAGILRVFEELRDSGENIALLVAGDFVSSDLERAVAPLLSAPGILRTGYTPEHEFWRYAAAVDGCINLRYPLAGETSGIAIRLMGIGKPVILTAGAETSRFPDSACLRVDPGPREESMLRDFMIWLSHSPKSARYIGRLAGEYVRKVHSVEAAAGQYWETLKTVAGIGQRAYDSA